MINECADEETLVDFIEDRLSDRLRMDIEKHIAACPDCLDRVAIYSRLVYGEYSNHFVEAPQKIANSAIVAISNQAESDSFDRLKNTAKNLLAKGKEAIEQLTFTPIPEFAPIRGVGTDQTDNIIRIQKTINHLEFVAEMERTSDNMYAVRVTLAAEQPNLIDIRISLFAGEREIASSLWRGSTVSFENIAFGSHALVFARNGEMLAEYKFDVQAKLQKKNEL